MSSLTLHEVFVQVYCNDPNTATSPRCYALKILGLVQDDRAAYSLCSLKKKLAP